MNNLQILIMNVFFKSEENAKFEKSAVLISLVYPCSRKEIRLIGQDLPFYIKACWQDSLISLEPFVTTAS